MGDQYKPDTKIGGRVTNSFFKNNLFIAENSWPDDIGLSDILPVIGDPEFTNKRGIDAADYTPKNVNLIKNKGLELNILPNDTAGLFLPLKIEKDILGNIIEGKPSIGAIEP